MASMVDRLQCKVLLLSATGVVDQIRVDKLDRTILQVSVERSSSATVRSSLHKHGALQNVCATLQFQAVRVSSITCTITEASNW